MGNIFNFYRENFHTIIISSILLFTLIVIFSMFEIDFNIQRNINTLNTNPNRIMKVETLSNLKDKDKDKDLPNEKLDSTFCKTNQNDHVKLNELCKQFDNKTCNSTRCCAWVKHDKGEGCFAGDKHGPFFKGTQEKPIIIDFYSFKNECYPELKPCEK